MTWLSAQSIRVRDLIQPFNERYVVSGVTRGLSSAGYDICLRQEVTVVMGYTTLASSVERFTMPNDIGGRVNDKSTWKRRGVSVGNTIIEPGWQGYLTLELTLDPVLVFNRDGTRDVPYGKEIIIPAGVPIAQITFEFLDQPTEQPYKGKYQDQPDRPVAAILER